MVIVQSLCRIAVKQYFGEDGEKLVRMLTDHFSDHSLRLTGALQKANDRAWKAFELALAGDSCWERMKGAFARGEDKALAMQVRSFLDAHPLNEFVAEPRVRELCLRDLHAARKAGRLQGDLDTQALAAKIRANKRLADPLAMARDDLDAVGEIAAYFKDHGHKHIAW